MTYLYVLKSWAGNNMPMKIALDFAILVVIGRRFSRMSSKGFRFTLGVWGLRVCSLDVAQPFATVRNRPQPFAGDRVRAVWPCLW